jgi:hypothetical protein
VNFTEKTDAEIIALLRAGTYTGWEHLYNKYAALMYGTIMRQVGFNHITAGELLTQSFLDLKNEGLFSPLPGQSLTVYLVQHCYQVISKNAKATLIKQVSSPYVEEPFPFLKAALRNRHPLTVIAAKIGVSSAVARDGLRLELKNARTKLPVSGKSASILPPGDTGNIHPTVA